jgi:hypothetical protein
MMILIIRTRDLVCQTPTSKNLVGDSILEAIYCQGEWERCLGAKLIQQGGKDT